MRMLRRPLALVLALVLGASSAVLLACGDSENPRLIASSRADRLTGALDDVRSAVEAGDCEGADSALGRLESQISDLPARTDDRIVSRLESGLQNLREKAAQECLDNQTDTTTTETTPTVTETVPTTTTPTETTPTTTETTPTTTTTTPTTTTTTPTTPDESGGAQPGGAGQ
jgi:hypothetical protein